MKQGIIQQKLNKYYRFKLADVLCEYFNKFINTLEKKERKKRGNKREISMLDPSHERKYMSGREILENT